MYKTFIENHECELRVLLPTTIIRVRLLCTLVVVFCRTRIGVLSFLLWLNLFRLFFLPRSYLTLTHFLP